MDSGFRVLDSGLIQWNLDSGFHSLVGFRIPWAVFWIPKPRILDSTSKIFPDFGFYMSKFSQIPESGFTYMGGSRGGTGGPAPLIYIISRPNWGPECRKKFSETAPPPLSQGLDDRPSPPLIWRSVSASATQGLLTFFSFPCLSKTGGTSGSCGCSSSSWPKNHKSTYTGI